MSDHIDGPRVIGDPAADLSDLFAFTSPEDAARTVVAADVFPGAGQQAAFSNAIEHSIVVRRVRVAGTGAAARFEPEGPEIRFTFRFDTLEPAADGGDEVVQRGTCTLPGDQELDIVVNDERGAVTPDGLFRVFAGLRSDPFILAWQLETMQPAPNLLQHDNVLSIIVEFDTRAVLDPDRGSLFGVIAETVPTGGSGMPVGHPPPRIDWVGRPEQTNMRLNNGGLVGTDDLRDLWNQQQPFAVNKALEPLFLQRLEDSLENWDQRDGETDWAPDALAASARVFLDDFLLFDVSKSITDASHLEIEKSTLDGRRYETGGGRTVDANVIDIMLTWMVNRDREALHGGATRATKTGTRSFPYLASPNTELQSVTQSVDLPASADEVWALIGPFGATWHPLIATITLTGTGVGQLRTIETIDGQRIVERLEARDDRKRYYRYGNVSGIPASHYTGRLSVTPKGKGCTVEWRAQFLADGQATFVVTTMVTTLLKTGLDSLSARYTPVPA